MAYTEALAEALREALAEVENALARDAGKRVRQIRVTTNKGF